MTEIDTWHGTTGGYTNHRCRCDQCRASWAAYMYDLRRTRKARLDKDPTLATHGTESTYTNWLCRCQTCRDAHAYYTRHKTYRATRTQ